MSESDEFAGKVALVTCSTSGIGEAVARRLAAGGASVMLNSASSVEPGRHLDRRCPSGGQLDHSATPADCAEATLACLRTTYMTGNILVTDGGVTIVS